ncbi:MAG: GLUG motif-containing protein [Phycisphaerales bacterium]
MNRHRIQFVVSFLVFVLGGVVGAVEFAGGTGEPNDPYLIATAEQLLEADFSVPGTYFQLSCDIDLDRRTVEPCGFRAHLDGAGFEIGSVLITWNTSFFGIILPEGAITNLTLTDLDLGCTSLREDDQINSPVGAMAAENYGTITNCAVTGWVVTRQGEMVGGLVGHNSGLIKDSYFEGWVSTDWENTDGNREIFRDWSKVGGLVSWNSGTIANSFARSIVVGKEGLGGIAGYNSGTIRNCYAWGTVVGGMGSGGLVARNSGSLHRCWAVGLVTGQMRGGLIGMADSYDGTATDCLWDSWSTGCETSAAGVGIFGLGADSPTFCALNGWAGDPNWVAHREPGNFENYPRLAWEDTDGESIPEISPLWDPDGGSGTESDPYVIKEAASLEYLCKASILWDSHFVLAEDLNVAFRWEFSPIGVCRGSSFSGKFDGNGHVIRNINLGSDEATAWNWGVFGYVTGEICNLRLENIELEGAVNSQRVGLLAGTCTGVIRNCSATGSIRVGESSRYIGELVGYSSGEVSGCEATATIEAGEGSTDIGGLQGYQMPRRGG